MPKSLSNFLCFVIFGIYLSIPSLLSSHCRSLFHRITLYLITTPPAVIHSMSILPPLPDTYSKEAVSTPLSWLYYIRPIPFALK